MRSKLVLLFAAVLISSYTFASGLPVNQIVAFGDSLTDTGNIFVLTGGAIPPAGYAPGRFTNPQSGSGPSGNWLDQFSSLIGLPDPAAVLLGGSNFAFGGATTTGGVVPSMDLQVSAALGAVGGHAPSNALYSFWGGGNDILNGQSPAGAADNIFNEILSVSGDGGKYFLWFNLPSLGQTPEGSSNAVLLNGASAAFNAEWALDLSKLKADGVNVIGVDVNSLFNQIVADPSHFGFTNVTDSCYVDPTTICSDPNTYLFWDGIHPTTFADSYIASLAFHDVSATPEPTSLALLALGGAGLLFWRKKRL